MKLVPAKRLSGPALRKAKRAYLAGLMQGGVISDGLDSAGVTLDQLKRWRETDPEFKMLEDQAKLLDDDILRRRIRQYIQDGNIDIIKASMKRLPEYSPTQKTEVSVTGEVKHKHISELPESEIDAIIRAGADLIEADYEVVGDASRQRDSDMPRVQSLPNPSVDRRDS
jgi:hypothetical protein